MDKIQAIIFIFRSFYLKKKGRYAVIEADKLPDRGQKYIRMILGCDEKTIQQGLIDLSSEDELKNG
jgi:hypothetical protein